MESKGVGILEQHCPISVLKPHPSKGHCQRKRSGIPGRGWGGGVQTLPINGMKWQSNESRCRWPGTQALMGLTVGNGECAGWLLDLLKLHFCYAKSQINTMSSILLDLKRTRVGVKLLFLPCFWRHTPVKKFTSYTKTQQGNSPKQSSG